MWVAWEAGETVLVSGLLLSGLPWSGFAGVLRQEGLRPGRTTVMRPEGSGFQRFREYDRPGNEDPRPLPGAGPPPPNQVPLELLEELQPYVVLAEGLGRAAVSLVRDHGFSDLTITYSSPRGDDLDTCLLRAMVIKVGAEGSRWRWSECGLLKDLVARRVQ